MNDKYLAILHGICARLYSGPINDNERSKLADTLATCLSDIVTDIVDEVANIIRRGSQHSEDKHEAEE